jgi:hypothetical protein
MIDHADAVPVDPFARFGRSDHDFLRMAEAHLPLIDELLMAFDAEGLKTLARRLPFHRKAWLVVIPDTIRHLPSDLTFTLWLSHHSFRATDAAVYCAVAAHGMLSRELSKIEVMFDKTRGRLRELIEFVQEVSKPKTRLLAEAIRCGQRGDG